MKCPKCGRSAYGGLVVNRVSRILVDGMPQTKTYAYREYLHYAGSRKTITLKSLEDISNELIGDFGSAIGVAQYQRLLIGRVKERAGSKVVHHYGPV